MITRFRKKNTVFPEGRRHPHQTGPRLPGSETRPLGTAACRLSQAPTVPLWDMRTNRYLISGPSFAANYRPRGASWPAKKSHKEAQYQPEKTVLIPGAQRLAVPVAAGHPPPEHSPGCWQARVCVQVTRSTRPGQEL